MAPGSIGNKAEDGFSEQSAPVGVSMGQESIVETPETPTTIRTTEENLKQNVSLVSVHKHNPAEEAINKNVVNPQQSEDFSENGSGLARRQIHDRLGDAEVSAGFAI